MAVVFPPSSSIILLTLGFIWADSVAVSVVVSVAVVVSAVASVVASVVAVVAGMVLTGTAVGAAWTSGISATEGAILIKRMDAAVV